MTFVSGVCSCRLCEDEVGTTLIKLPRRDVEDVECKHLFFGELLHSTFHMFGCLTTGESTGCPVPTVLQSVPRLQGPQISPLSQV